VGAALRQYEKGRHGPAFLIHHTKYCLLNYCAGAGAGVAGAGSAGFGASGVAGFIGCSAAGGLVLWVVVLSVPLSLQAATPSKANAETDARTSFFITSLLQQTLTFQ
jgi:hypothetical protein